MTVTRKCSVRLLILLNELIMGKKEQCTLRIIVSEKVFQSSVVNVELVGVEFWLINGLVFLYALFQVVEWKKNLCISSELSL